MSHFKLSLYISYGMLYGKLPAISLTIKERRMRLSGHCYRHTDTTNVMVPQDGHTRRSRHRISYIDNILAETGVCNTNELAKL